MLAYKERTNQVWPNVCEVAHLAKIPKRVTKFAGSALQAAILLTNCLKRNGLLIPLKRNLIGIK